jgi:mannose-6-phosphate isomerase
VDLLDNVIQEYAWGSRTALAELLGQPVPSPKPQAEVWMGAHPSAPSRLPGGQTLLDKLQAAPEQQLGKTLVQAYGPRLPFLLKLLAAGTPLSLQAHPSLAQARVGFARENALGLPLTAPHRNYKDDNHKPELICALTPFEALCGFRPVAQIRTLLAALAHGRPGPLDHALRTLDGQPTALGLKTLFGAWMQLTSGPRTELLAQVLEGCRDRPPAEFAFACGWAVTLGSLYPGDIGAACSLLLNAVMLQPGEALYLPAGNLHAYLRGLGVELMASSDNVLRGGLTPKHVDVPELLSVLDFRNEPARILRAEPSGDGPETVWPTPAEEFRLSLWTLRGETFTPSRRGPEILWCAQGALTVRTSGQATVLHRGQSVFVSAAEGPFQLQGTGELFRATAGTAWKS